MPGQKITQRSPLASVAVDPANDLLGIVDLSAGAAGSKKITVDNLIKGWGMSDDGALLSKSDLLAQKERINDIHYDPTITALIGISNSLDSIGTAGLPLGRAQLVITTEFIGLYVLKSGNVTEKYPEVIVSNSEPTTRYWQLSNIGVSLDNKQNVSDPYDEDQIYIVHDRFIGIGLNDPITISEGGVITGEKTRISNPGPGRVVFTFTNFAGTRKLEGQSYVVNSNYNRNQTIRSSSKIPITDGIAVTARFISNNYRNNISLGWGNSPVSCDSAGLAISQDQSDSTQNSIGATTLYNSETGSFDLSMVISRLSLENGEEYQFTTQLYTTDTVIIWVQGGLWDRLYDCKVGSNRHFPLIKHTINLTNSSLYAILGTYSAYGDYRFEVKEFSVIKNFKPSQDVRILDYLENGTAAHIPSILPLADGREICTWQKGSADASPDQGLWGAVRTANGWTEPQPLMLSLGNGSVYQNGAIGFINGQIWWIYSRSNAAVTAYPHYYRILTIDNSGNIIMGAETAIPNLAVGYLVYNPPIQTATGRIIIPTFTYDATEVSPVAQVAIVYSDNNGVTWTTINYGTPSMPGHTPEYVGYMVEPALAIEEDGTTLRIIVRSQFRGTAGNPANPDGMSLTATSVDNGSTWTQFQPYVIPQTIGGPSGDIGQRVTARKMPDGRIMAFASDDQRNRKSLTAWIIGSGGVIDDQMLFGNHSEFIDSGSMQYPDGFYKNGMIHTVYSDKTNSGAPPRNKSQIVYVAQKWRSGRPYATKLRQSDPFTRLFGRAIVENTIGVYDANNIVLNADEGNVFTILLTPEIGSTRNIVTPINPYNGQKITIRIRQASDIGSRAVVFNSSWVGFSGLTPDLNALGVNIYEAMYDALDAKWYRI